MVTEMLDDDDKPRIKGAGHGGGGEISPNERGKKRRGGRLPGVPNRTTRILKDALITAAEAAGAPKIDLSALQDVQDPDYLRLHDAIEARLIHFENNVARPSASQEPALDGAAAEMRELIQVSRNLGFPVKVTIVGHADATGKENSNLALSLGRAEVVRSMLRARGVDPLMLAVRGAGPLEPLRPGASVDELSMNRRVSFVVSTGE